MVGLKIPSVQTNTELGLFDPNLPKKPQIVALKKN